MRDILDDLRATSAAAGFDAQKVQERRDEYVDRFIEILGWGKAES